MNEFICKCNWNSVSLQAKIAGYGCLFDEMPVSGDEKMKSAKKSKTALRFCV